MRSESRGESKEDVCSWIKPLGPSFITTLGLIRPYDLLLKDGENVAGGCWGCGWMAWVAKPGVLLEDDSVFPLPSAVWYGKASLNMVWGRCVVGGVSVIS